MPLLPHLLHIITMLKHPAFKAIGAVLDFWPSLFTYPLLFYYTFWEGRNKNYTIIQNLKISLACLLFCSKSLY